VHEAYLRLVEVDKAQHWDSRRHFFAAAEASVPRKCLRRLRSRSTKWTVLAADRFGSHSSYALNRVTLQLNAGVDARLAVYFELIC
jgi:hypothetical protein